MSSSTRVAAAFLLAGVCLLAVLYVGNDLPKDAGNGWDIFNFHNWSSADTPKDSDGDGIPDSVDKYPHDRDNDGFNDSVDLVPDSDAGFAFYISSIQLDDQIAHGISNANVHFLVNVDGVSQTIDDSGEDWNCQVAKPTVVNQTFYFNLADDVRNHTIEITMVSSSGYTLDIDGSSASGYTLKGTFDIVTGTWSGNDNNGVADGSRDGSSAGDAKVAFSITACAYEEVKNFSWSFDNTSFSLQLTIPTSSYDAVKSNGVDREYHTSYDDVKTFVTPDDPIIQNLTSRLEELAQEHGYTGEDNVNFVLSFVQNIGYSTDQDSEGVNEYWRFPVETLYDHTGDCEDTSFLFGSIMEAMGQNAAMIIFPNADHMGAGVAWSSIPGGTYFQYDGQNYYYCETTDTGWVMGKLPDSSNSVSGSLEGQQAVVVPV